MNLRLMAVETRLAAVEVRVGGNEPTPIDEVIKGFMADAAIPLDTQVLRHRGVPAHSRTTTRII